FIRFARHHACDRQSAFSRAKYAAFIDVVAVVVDEIETLLREPTVSCIKPVFVLLAAGNGETHLSSRGARRRQRTRPAYPAALPAHVELVVVISARLQTCNLDMHRVAKLGMCDCHSSLRHLPHRGVRRQRPTDLDRALRHSTTALQGLWCDLGPNYHAVR